MGDSDPEISENETDPEPDEKADKDFPPLKKKSSSRTTTRWNLTILQHYFYNIINFYFYNFNELVFNAYNLNLCRLLKKYIVWQTMIQIGTDNVGVKSS